MIAWQCSLCGKKNRTDVRPLLQERLCPECKVRHWERLLMMYARDQRGEQYRNAKAQLTKAREALEEVQ